MLQTFLRQNKESRRNADLHRGLRIINGVRNDVRCRVVMRSEEF